MLNNFKAASGKTYENELSIVCDFYQKDFDRDDLQSQLRLFKTLYMEKTEEGVRPCIKVLKGLLSDLSPAQRSLTDVCKAFQLLLVIPATNATSERSFSALRWVKSYLRSTMHQARLNHLMLLYYHQDLTDK